MRLQGRAGVVDRGGDEEEAAAACAGGGGGFQEVGQDGFDGVVGAEDVDVDHGFEGVGGELGEWGEEIACCSGAGGRKGGMVRILGVVLMWIIEGWGFLTCRNLCLLAPEHRCPLRDSDSLDFVHQLSRSQVLWSLREQS